MSIDAIGPINNYNNFNKVSKKTSVNKTTGSDSVNISEEAALMAERNKIMALVNKAPDVRAEKVNELKAKINNPDYINNKLTESLADKIMDSLNI